MSYSNSHSTGSGSRRFAKMILDHEHLTLTLLPSLWLVILFNLLNPHLMLCAVLRRHRQQLHWEVKRGKDFQFIFYYIFHFHCTHKSQHKYKVIQICVTHIIVVRSLHTIESSRMTIKYFIRRVELCCRSSFPPHSNERPTRMKMTRQQTHQPRTICNQLILLAQKG